VSRLRQIKVSPGGAADRAFLEGVFGTHPYGHGTLGTTRMLESTSLEDVRQFHEGMFSADGATLIVAGAVPAGEVMTSARAHFGGWRGRPGRRQPPPPRPPAPLTWRLVDRPGAPQSELRIGHLGPSRKSPAYHAMVVLNAALGGQFTSRINLQLREKKGFTYGARTSVDYRRTCSTFACETSVQSDATIEAIADVLAEFRAVGSDRPAAGDELARAQASLTRGYVRQFETAAQLARAAIELAKFHLPDGTFDAFVPRISAVTAADTLAAAHASVQPEACVVAIVGDAGRFREGLSEFQRTVVEVIPEF
jgi:zinc protease